MEDDSLRLPPPERPEWLMNRHDESPPYDALLIVGFGGPEKREDVIPFLENVLRGRNVPRERMMAVAEHYDHLGGVSPINAQVRRLIEALTPELKTHGVDLPLYWGNRNWHPLLTDTIEQMKNDGVERALAVVLAAYSSYSSCRQYREDIGKAREAVGDGAPAVDKMRVFYNHPGFIAANAERVRDALARLNDSPEPIHLTFTAHSIPASMAANCDYERQLTETCRLVAETVGIPADRWKLVYQSRSGRPQDPWLGPDVLDHLRTLHEAGVTNVIVHPVGFLSDHMEVLYDLDDEARHLAESLGMRMERSATVGTHPAFVRMLRELIVERIDELPDKPAIGRFPANHDVCPADCCLPAARPGR
jgi:ferrochelatase